MTVLHRGQTHAEDLPREVTEVLGERADLPRHAREFAPDVVLDMMPMRATDAETVMRTFRGVAGRIVAISSMDVYRAYGRFNGLEPGEPDPVPLTETSPLRETLYPYRATATGPEDPLHDYDKIPVEQIVLGDPELPGTVLRLPAVYGPRDYRHRVFPYLKRMDDGRPEILLGVREARWRWSRGYVDNVAAVIACAITDPRAAGETFNVCDAATLGEAQWVEAIGRAAGWTGRVVTLPDDSLPAHLRRDCHWEQDLHADSGRIRAVLGCEEVVTLEEGMRLAVEWQRSHPPESVNPDDFDYAAEDAALAACGRP